jgi:hypothetical protein
MKKLLFLLLITCCSITGTMGQGRLLGRFLGKGDSTRRGSFLVLPAIGYAQETGWEFGVVSLASFYTDKSDTLTRVSNIGGLAAFTTKKQSNFTIRPDIWSPGNRYHYSGELKYRDFPFNFYGTGDKTLKAEEDKLTLRLVRVAAEGEKRFNRGAYTGLNFAYENYAYTDDEPGGIYQTNTAIRDKDGGQVLFLGFSQAFDGRNTNTYTTRGSFVKFNYSYAPDLFGGENFSGSLFKLDFRNFKSYSEKTVLGINAVYSTIQGSRTPFYLLQQMGNDQVMRGYYTGRYRDQNLLALQAELRYRLIPRLGVVAFGGTGSVYGTGTFRLNRFKPTYGGGLRYFYDPVRGLSLRFDYAFGEKRPGEAVQKGFYLSLGEAF